MYVCDHDMELNKTSVVALFSSIEGTRAAFYRGSVP